MCWSRVRGRVGPLKGWARLLMREVRVRIGRESSLVLGRWSSIRARRRWTRRGLVGLRMRSWRWKVRWRRRVGSWRERRPTVLCGRRDNVSSERVGALGRRGLLVWMLVVMLMLLLSRIHGGWFLGAGTAKTVVNLWHEFFLARIDFLSLSFFFSLCSGSYCGNAACSQCGAAEAR